MLCLKYLVHVYNERIPAILYTMKFLICTVIVSYLQIRIRLFVSDFCFHIKIRL